jgi:DNA adenine methylase
VDRQALKPPFAYYGGKMTLGPQIAALLPEHDHYVEPFAGSLAVLLAKEPSRAETVNDLDGDLITFWRILRDEPESLARLALLTPHSRDEYESSRSLVVAANDLERARRVWVRLTQGRSHSMKPTGWKNAIRATARQPLPDTLVTFAKRILPAADRLKGVTLENRDALDLIRDYGSEPSVCIYADPPYVGSTRATNYGVEMTRDDQHEAFAQACHDASASVVISGYESGLYDDLFGDWHRFEFAPTRGLHGKATESEVLWSNRPLGEPDLFADFGSAS